MALGSGDLTLTTHSRLQDKRSAVGSDMMVQENHWGSDRSESVSREDFTFAFVGTALALSSA